MKIGALATLTNTQVGTIRYYERENLLGAASRSDGNYRMYGEADVERLSFIRHCRSLDLTLDEIRMLLKFKDAPAENCHEVNDLLDEHIGHVAQRISELRQLESQLKNLRETCLGTQEARHCGILNELSEIAKAPAPGQGQAGHVHGAHAAGAGRKASRKS